ncbi:MAG: hypothetical protein AAF763_05520 [Pseudomonadota bacterium]
MKPLSVTLAGAVSLFAIAAMATEAQAVTSLGMFVNDYGSDAGKVDPGGTDVLGADFVTVSDSSSTRFSDSFDLSGLFGTFNPGFLIDRLELTLDFSEAGPSGFWFFGFGESWNVRVQGSNSSASNDDLFVQLNDASAPQSLTVSILSDTGSTDAFVHSLLTENFEFWFSETTTLADNFDLDSAKLEVFGTATVIPTPFALPLLASAFGVAALFRRGSRRTH